MSLRDVITEVTRRGEWQRGRALEWAEIAEEAMTLADQTPDQTAIAMMVVNRCRRAANAARSEADQFGVDGNRQVAANRSERRWLALALAIESRCIRHYERLADAARQVA